MEEIIEHILPWAEDKKKGPYEAELRITRKCNLKCFHCPGYDKKIMGSNLLTINDWLQIIRDCDKIGIKECLIFAEGEPMVSEMALPLMNEVKKYGLRGKTATNGTLFTKESIMNLVEIDWDQIYISLDAPDAQSHNYIRGEGVFERIMKNLKLINKIKKKKKKKFPDILFNTVITNLNFNKFEEMIKLAYELDVSTICFHPLNLWTNEAKKLKLNSKQISEMQQYITKAIQLGKRCNVRNNLNTYFEKGWLEDSWKQKNEVRKMSINKNHNPKKSHPFLSVACYLPWYFVSINEDGRVNPCHSIHHNKENIHNKDIKEIWFGNYFNDIRNHLLKNHIPKDCSTTCCAMQATEHSSFREQLLKRYDLKN